MLFFTVEVERSAGNDAPLHAVNRRRPRRLWWIGLGIVGALSAIAAACGGWLLAGGDPRGLESPGWLAFVTPAIAAEGDAQARLDVISQPAGATVTLDGHQRGSTPLALSVAHGVHTLVLKHPEAIDEQRQVSVGDDTTINVRMWPRRPTAMLLKPPYPGASLADVSFLEDGRLALSVAVPATSKNTGERPLREPWVYDPTVGSLVQFTAQGSSPRAAEVSISPDGHRLAYVQPDPSASHTDGVSARLTEVLIASDDTTARPRASSRSRRPLPPRHPARPLPQTLRRCMIWPGRQTATICSSSSDSRRLAVDTLRLPDRVCCWWTPPRNNSSHLPS